MNQLRCVIKANKAIRCYGVNSLNRHGVNYSCLRTSESHRNTHPGNSFATRWREFLRLRLGRSESVFGKSFLVAPGDPAVPSGDSPDGMKSNSSSQWGRPFPRVALRGSGRRGRRPERASRPMPLGFDPHHPGGMAENSPAFQRRDAGERPSSPEGTVEALASAVPLGLMRHQLQTRR